MSNADQDQLQLFGTHAALALELQCHTIDAALPAAGNVGVSVTDLLATQLDTLPGPRMAATRTPLVFVTEATYLPLMLVAVGRFAAVLSAGTAPVAVHASATAVLEPSASTMPSDNCERPT